MSNNASKYRDRYIKRAARVLPAIKLGENFTPETINKIVGGEYSAKFLFYMRELGFEFSQQKDGRKIVSYTLIKEPGDAETIRAATPSKTRGRASSSASKKIEPVKTSKVNKTKAPKKAAAVAPRKVATAKKSVADIKSANLAKLKTNREDDEVTKTFGSNGEVSTSFSIDRDWDSADGLDLSRLI